MVNMKSDSQRKKRLPKHVACAKHTTKDIKTGDVLNCSEGIKVIWISTTSYLNSGKLVTKLSLLLYFMLMLRFYLDKDFMFSVAEEENGI